MTGEVSVDIETPTVALAVGAHPDDIEFGCGAALARWADAGAAIHHLVMTDGSKGTWDADADPAELVATRRAEQEAAAEILRGPGGGEVVFGPWVDGELASGPAQARFVASHIRRLRPTVVLTHDPWKRYRLHPDHRHCGFAVIEAVVAARDPHFLKDLDMAPHRPDEVLLFEPDEPDHVERATPEMLARKTDALLAHRSQALSTMDIADPDDPDDQARFAGWIEARAAEHGALAGVLAGEMFKRIRHGL